MGERGRLSWIGALQRVALGLLFGGRRGSGKGKSHEPAGYHVVLLNILVFSGYLLDKPLELQRITYISHVL